MCREGALCVRVVSELVLACIFQARKRGRKGKHSDTHQVVSEWESVCILQTEEKEDRALEDSVGTCLQVGSSP
jgi:hypothetical protein